MTKQEFEERVGMEVLEYDYQVANKVYMWHPLCECQNPKGKIAELFRAGGHVLMEDMIPRAVREQERQERAM
jgi:hypothetical protein